MPPAAAARTTNNQQQQHHKHPPIAWLPASWTLALLTAALAVSAFVSRYAPDSYMDEPFHVPMAQQYCAGDLVSWDPKITTFPGLYYLGAGYAWLSHLLLYPFVGAKLELTCSVPYLRSFNAVLAVVCIQLAYALSVELQRQPTHTNSSSSTSSSGKGSGGSKRTAGVVGQEEQQQQADKATGVALVVGLLPTQLFFAFLFYTDVASLLFLLATELLLLRGCTYAAAGMGAAAIGMRQTNAVWVTFLTGAAMLQELLSYLQQQQQQQQQPASKANGAAAAHRRNGSTPTGKQPVSHARPEQPQGGVVHMLRELCSLLLAAWQHKGQLLAKFWLLLLLPVAFCAFVVLNGSITLGDKEAHAPSAHLMQPLYFGLFCLANAALLLLQPSITQPLLSSCRARPVLWLAGLVAAVAGGSLLAARYSLAHPYLLADNRHYTFYLWRKVVNRHWAGRYCLVPGYVLAWLLLLSGLLATQHWVWVGAFVASCCVTLVPAWLIEFRYFTAPFALAILHLPAPPKAASLATAAAFVAVNAATLYVFTLRPFAWPDGSTARFMW